MTISGGARPSPAAMGRPQARAMTVPHGSPAFSMTSPAPLHDQTRTFAYNPAGQIIRETSFNSLNQHTSVAGAPVSHDSLGNTTAADGATFGFDRRNRLTSASPGGSLRYDPAGRLYEENSGGAAIRFAYAGSAPIEEKTSSGAVQRRYVPGAGVDETLVWYEGAGTTDKRQLLADARGHRSCWRDSGAHGKGC